MTTRSRQKLSSILAVFSIVALLLLLIFVWTAVRNGVFSSVNENGSYRWRPIDSSDSSTLMPSDEHSSHHHSHGHHHHHHHHHNESTTSHGKFVDTFVILPNPCHVHRFLLSFSSLQNSSPSTAKSAQYKRNRNGELRTFLLKRQNPLNTHALHMDMRHNDTLFKWN